MNIDVISLAECFSIDKNKYPNSIKTERLLLKKSDQTDCTTVLYSIYLSFEPKQEIGEVVLIFDGEIWYKMNEQHRNKGYITEALNEILKISNKKHYLSIEDQNIPSKKVAKKLGFHKTKKIGDSQIYRKST